MTGTWQTWGRGVFEVTIWERSSWSAYEKYRFRLQKEIKNYWRCVSLRLHHTYLKDLSSGISSLQHRDDTCQSWCLLYCFMHKYVKKHENTVFGYKKGSKFDSDIGFGSATPKLCMVIFTTFLPKWLEHWKPEGTPLSPPAVFEVTIWERFSWSVYHVFTI